MNAQPNPAASEPLVAIPEQVPGWTRSAIFQAAKACAAHAFDQHIPNSPSQKFWQSHADNLNSILDAIDSATPVHQAAASDLTREQVDAVWDSQMPSGYAKSRYDIAHDLVALALHQAAEPAPTLADTRHEINTHANNLRAYVDSLSGDAFQGAIHSLGALRDIIDGLLALAASPALRATGVPAELIPGWKVSAAQKAGGDEDISEGVWELGHVNEDGEFFGFITVDTGNYFQPQDAEPLALAILARLAPPPVSDDDRPAWYGVQDEVALTRAVSVMNDVLTDISGWEDRALSEAVEDSKIDLCAMIECIRMSADDSYVPGSKPIDGEAAPLAKTPAVSEDTKRLDVPEAISAIIENLHTQDNRITDNPLFAVQHKRRFGGVDSEYADASVWIADGCEVDSEEAARLDALREAGEPVPDGCRRIGYIDRWEFVTGCLTEQGCKDYIRANGHNLHEPRIYAYGSYRNAEFIALRKWLMSLRAARPPADGATGGAETLGREKL